MFQVGVRGHSRNPQGHGDLTLPDHLRYQILRKNDCHYSMLQQGCGQIRCCGKCTGKPLFPCWLSFILLMARNGIGHLNGIAGSYLEAPFLLLLDESVKKKNSEILLSEKAG
jgi:hypothetical protein